MEREDAVATLEREYGIRGGQFYLLEVIPLVEMLWADGRNQDEEINLVHDFLDQYMRRLTEAAEGTRFISDEELNDFIERFINRRPSSELLRDIRRLADSALYASADQEEVTQRRQSVLDYCLDIAAAAVTEYPYPRHERFMVEEKRLLRELMSELHLEAGVETAG